MKKLAVSILNQDKPYQLINKLIDMNINHVHYDVMDKKFVQNKAFSIKDIKKIVKNTNKHIVDVHLMVINPQKYIQKLKRIVDYFSIHFESISEKEIKNILEKNPSIKIGLAIKPQTNLKAIYSLLPYVSHVLIMSVEPGKGGQKFINSSLKKISNLKTIINDKNLKTLIEVDGGITNKTGPQVIESGADSLVSGSFLVKNVSNKNIKKEILGS